MDEDLQLGDFLRTDPRQLRSALRTPVLARVDRLSRNSGRVHAREGDRLLRELAPSDGVTAVVRDRQSRTVEGLWRERLGSDGGGRSVRYYVRDQRTLAAVLDVHCARRGSGRD